MLIGYARVSTVDQNSAMQLLALKRAGCRRIFDEKQSAVRQRAELERVLVSLRAGDVLCVYKLDRLARSLSHLLQILERVRAAGACIRSLTEPIDDTTPAGRMMLQVLGSVAEFERSLILERSEAGRRAAKARGVHCGRPRTLPADVEGELVRDWETGFYTFDGLAHRYGVHPATVKRAVYRVHKPGHSSLL